MQQIGESPLNTFGRLREETASNVMNIYFFLCQKDANISEIRINQSAANEKHVSLFCAVTISSTDFKKSQK